MRRLCGVLLGLMVVLMVRVYLRICLRRFQRGNGGVEVGREVGMRGDQVVKRER